MLFFLYIDTRHKEPWGTEWKKESNAIANGDPENSLEFIRTGACSITIQTLLHRILRERELSHDLGPTHSGFINFKGKVCEHAPTHSESESVLTRISTVKKLLRFTS